MAVEFRPITLDDVNTVVEEYERTWGIADAIGAEPSRELSRHFVLHYLAPSTYAILAHDEGQFLGLLMARVFGDSVLFPQVRNLLKEHDDRMQRSDSSVRIQALQSAHAMRAIEISLEAKSHINDLTQAEVELFLVSPSARGRGVGGGLWNDAMQYLRCRGVNRYYLHTDSACDVSFYDHYGLEQNASWNHQDHPNKAKQVKDLVEDLYIYSGEPRGRHARR